MPRLLFDENPRFFPSAITVTVGNSSRTKATVLSFEALSTTNTSLRREALARRSEFRHCCKYSWWLLDTVIMEMSTVLITPTSIVKWKTIRHQCEKNAKEYV